MSDRRKTGEGAMKGWSTRRSNELSHGDFCRLSRAFNMTANLMLAQDCRINEWLKRQIARAALAMPRSADDKSPWPAPNKETIAALEEAERGRPFHLTPSLNQQIKWAESDPRENKEEKPDE